MVKSVVEDIETPNKEYANLLKILGESTETRFWDDFIKQTHGTSAKMLEFGAGSGNLAIPLANAGITVSAVEIDPYSAQHIIDQAPSNLDVIVSKVEDTNLAEKFDLVLSKSCIMYIPRTNTKGFFNSAARHLSHNGVFMVEVPDIKWLKGDAFLKNDKQTVTASFEKETGLWSIAAVYRTASNQSETYQLTESYNMISDEEVDKIAREQGLKLISSNAAKLNPITKYLAFKHI